MDYPFSLKLKGGGGVGGGQFFLLICQWKRGGKVFFAMDFPEFWGCFETRPPPPPPPPPTPPLGIIRGPWVVHHVYSKSGIFIVNPTMPKGGALEDGVLVSRRKSIERQKRNYDVVF